MAVVSSIMNFVVDKAVERCREEVAETEKNKKEDKPGDKIPTERNVQRSWEQIFKGGNPILGIAKRKVVTPRRQKLTAGEKERKEKDQNRSKKFLEGWCKEEVRRDPTPEVTKVVEIKKKLGLVKGRAEKDDVW